MNTIVYMIRHGESPKGEGTEERTRGLTDKGESDALRLAGLLQEEGIEVFVSSPYKRAVMTMEELARRSKREIAVVEDLKELVFSGEGRPIPDKVLYPHVRSMFGDPDYALPGGESAAGCRCRAVRVFQQLLRTHEGRRIAIGTHGLVMTLIMGHYDGRFGFDFLMSTSKPDVYRMEFERERLIDVKRLWGK